LVVAKPRQAERRIEHLRVAYLDTCLARTFQTAMYYLAIPGTRGADAAGNSGDIPTGANVARFLEHEMRRETTPATRKVNDGC
jgi:hypothetical protein